MKEDLEELKRSILNQIAFFEYDHPYLVIDTIEPIWAGGMGNSNKTCDIEIKIKVNNLELK